HAARRTPHPAVTARADAINHHVLANPLPAHYHRSQRAAASAAVAAPRARDFVFALVRNRGVATLMVTHDDADLADPALLTLLN
ncbi:MAG: hypothetical protein ABI434_06490, partial [Burkholderiaceae bacterium]